MDNFSSIAMAIAMIAALILAGGGVKLALSDRTKARGILMIVVALVLVMNVMIWTI